MIIGVRWREVEERRIKDGRKGGFRRGKKMVDRGQGGKLRRKSYSEEEGKNRKWGREKQGLGLI